MNANHFEISEGRLLVDGVCLLSDLPGNVTAAADALGKGIFLRYEADQSGSRQVFASGTIQGMIRFTACHRYEPFWMTAAAGTTGAQVPVETQYLLTELENNTVALFVPLIDGDFRCALQGNEAGHLELVAETGDPAVCGASVTGLFVAVGENPYTLLHDCAPSVNLFIGSGRLRVDKPLPSFADVFGWCTWDAFYQDVSHEKVRIGLESFRDGGVTPRMLILDDGWQTVKSTATGAQRLTAFEANEKFPNGLAPTVDMAKQEFGIETFIVWHAMTGYWGGVDGQSLPSYGVRSVARTSSPGINAHAPWINTAWGSIVGLVSPEHIYRFFQDYHRNLRKLGVDGVKVDTQATLEGVAYGSGGRVSLMRHYHEALEGSVHTHFKGNLINCMSCASEMLYGALNSNLTRSSTDFWPDKLESHGLHLYVNAQVSAWFGEFIHPDWDMFQSGHPMGAYHAAGRAVGGCPVYVSDKPDVHNFDILKKMVLPDGSVLRCAQPGRPTRDCLFHDPTKENVLLKIFNRSPEGGVLGVFHARYNAEGVPTEPISGAVSPEDIDGLEGDLFAVYAHNARELRTMARRDRWELTLPQLQFEVFTVVAIKDGYAPIGLADMFNSAGALVMRRRDPDGSFVVTLRSGGRFLIWCASRPGSVNADGTALQFKYDTTSRLLEVDLPAKSKTVVEIR